MYPTQQGGKQANENVKGYFPPTQNSNQLQINDVGLYSISKPKEAEQISQIIKSYFKSTKNLTITDANGNMGGNTINFAKHFGTVQTVEISKEHFDLLQNNINQYKHTNNVIIHRADYLQLISQLKQDIVFFDPPWGGRGYKKIKHLNLKLSDTDLAEIVNKLVGRAQMVALKVPVNFNIQDFYNKIKSNRVDMYKISSKKKVKIYQKKDDRTRAYSKEKVKMHLLIIHLTDL